MKERKINNLYYALIISVMMCVGNILQAKEYLPLVREGVVWEYIRELGTEPDVYQIIRLEFSGTETVNGKEYHILQMPLHVIMDLSSGIRNDILSYHLDYKPILMREEDGRVYRIRDEIDFETLETIKNEIMVWDFNVNPDDCIEIAMESNTRMGGAGIFCQGFMETRVIVVDSYEDMICGEQRRVIIMHLEPKYLDQSNYMLVEGIGPVPYAGITDGMQEETTEFTMNPGTISALEIYELPISQMIPMIEGTNFCLNFQYSSHGDILYMGKGFDWQGKLAAVEGIEAEEASSQPRYYNLQGIPVTSPEPGETVIRRIGSHAEKIVWHGTE